SKVSAKNRANLPAPRRARLFHRAALPDISTKNLDVATVWCSSHDDGVLTGQQDRQCDRGASRERPAAYGLAFGGDMIVHCVGDGPGLLAAAFIDKSIE